MTVEEEDVGISRKGTDKTWKSWVESPIYPLHVKVNNDANQSSSMTSGGNIDVSLTS